LARCLQHLCRAAIGTCDGAGTPLAGRANYADRGREVRAGAGTAVPVVCHPTAVGGDFRRTAVAGLPL